MIPGLEILNLHAQGGMAEVYRARGKGSDGRTWFYAVKRILPELTQDATLRSMFVEEARIASLLVHPNIVRVYDLARGKDDDYYIVMEFLEGRDLAETIDKAHDAGRALPVWLCIHAAREVLQALVYATTEARDREGRSLALIHRDISPHNIFVCFDGQVKLTDFGVAKVAQSNVLTQVGVTKGKFGYMSPEQLLSEKLDFRSDLFNVGILLYETLTGRRLFFGDNPSQFLQAMLRAEVPPLDPKLGVPAELEALVRRALAKDRGARPATAQQFDEALRAIAERYGLVATREHLATEVRALFGSEIESCPVPQARPATAPKMLASVQAAQPDAVRRVPSRIVPVSVSPVFPPVAPPVAPVPRAPTAPRAPVAAARPPTAPRAAAARAAPVAVDLTPLEPTGAPQLVPAQGGRTRSLSDPSVDVRNAPRELSRPIVDVRPDASRASRGDAAASNADARAESGDARATVSDADVSHADARAPREVRGATRPQGPSFASATGSGSGSKAPRPGTRSVRALDNDGPLDDPATLPPESMRRDDPSTLPPESAARVRKPTVIVVGGAGAKPIADKRDFARERALRDGARSRDDEKRAPDKAPRADEGDWGDATQASDPLHARPSIVTGSPRVVPLPSSRKK